MLAALLTAARSQTLHLLNVKNMRVGKSSYTFILNKVIKQSRPGFKSPVITFGAYPVDRRLCVFTVLQEYLFRTNSLRKSESLFISYIAPYKEVTKNTISRWIRTVMSMSGVDTQVFKAHSARSASVSSVAKFLPIEDILQTAGWSSQCTFAKYYNKNVNKSSQSKFAETVLSQVS